MSSGIIEKNSDGSQQGLYVGRSRPWHDEWVQIEGEDISPTELVQELGADDYHFQVRPVYDDHPEHGVVESTDVKLWRSPSESRNWTTWEDFGIVKPDTRPMLPMDFAEALEDLPWEIEGGAVINNGTELFIQFILDEWFVYPDTANVSEWKDSETYQNYMLFNLTHSGIVEGVGAPKAEVDTLVINTRVVCNNTLRIAYEEQNALTNRILLEEGAKARLVEVASVLRAAHSLQKMIKERLEALIINVDYQDVRDWIEGMYPLPAKPKKVAGWETQMRNIDRMWQENFNDPSVAVLDLEDRTPVQINDLAQIDPNFEGLEEQWDTSKEAYEVRLAQWENSVARVKSYHDEVENRVGIYANMHPHLADTAYGIFQAFTDTINYPQANGSIRAHKGRQESVRTGHYAIVIEKAFDFAYRKAVSLE